MSTKLINYVNKNYIQEICYNRIRNRKNLSAGGSVRLGCVWSGKCPSENCPSGKRPSGKSPSGKCLVGEMSIGEVSVGEVSGRGFVGRGSVRRESVHRGCVRRENVSRRTVRTPWLTRQLNINQTVPQRYNLPIFSLNTFNILFWKALDFVKIIEITQIVGGGGSYENRCHSPLTKKTLLIYQGIHSRSILLFMEFLIK